MAYEVDAEMTDKTVEKSGLIFHWKIENISHCWLKGEQILSPEFFADALEGTEWSLSLYPAGVNELDENEMNFYLLRLPGGSGPDVIDVNYQLAFLDKDGSILVEKTKLKENFGYDSGFDNFITRERVFVTERESFLPDDILTVQCSIWQEDEEKPINPEHLSARTVFNMNRRSFSWCIDNFSLLKPGLKYNFKDSSFDFHLVLNELDFDKKLIIYVNSYNLNIKYFSFKTSIVKSDGKKENCGTQEYFASNLKRGALCAILLTKKLTENKSHYLPNDVLSLECEYICSNGDVVYEHCGYGMIYPHLNNEVCGSRYECMGKVESSDISVLVNDMKSMYTDGIFSDIVLRTATKTFPAHKGILGSRSPVFRSMFSNNMKETNCGYVDITDLDDDTINRMLLYIYTNTLENLQFESAFKLYVAADKYEILSLQCRCSSFLVDNLCPSIACDVLILADQHHDDELRSSVQDYILKKQKQIFCSQEWKNFMNTHVKLAADVMYQKILWCCFQE